MQAGEVGVLLQIYPYASTSTSGISLTGATCTLEVQACGCNAYAEIETLPLTVSTDGTYAYRSTLATDFPYSGNYNIQLIATFTNGNTLKSPVQQLAVMDTLG